MLALHDDLTQFAHAIRGQDERAAAADSGQAHDQAHEWVARIGGEAERALGIYRNNYRGNLQGTLALTYPVIEQLVGTEFFSMMAREFIRLHPSRSGNLHHYGAQFADFVAGYAAAQHLVYLSDVAALEWACHQAYFAVDVAEFDAAQLAQVTPDQQARLRLLLHPACAVVRSAYPAAAIWHAHQPGAEQGVITLDQGGCVALVCRVNDVVQVHELNAATADWVEQVQAGVTLGEAITTVLERHADFDLGAALVQLLACCALAGFEVTELGSHQHQS